MVSYLCREASIKRGHGDYCWAQRFGRLKSPNVLVYCDDLSPDNSVGHPICRETPREPSFHGKSNAGRRLMVCYQGGVESGACELTQESMPLEALTAS